jgi:delta-aminolevulinic acid dehydratase/porphobilinogen synthase
VTEIITSLFRAGSDMIISYHTRDIFKISGFEFEVKHAYKEI